MAKMFYTLDEVKTMLGLDEAAVRDLVQQGKLRELHDGPRRVYKGEEVETLASQAPPGQQDAAVDSEADASGFSLEMADSTAAGLSGVDSTDTALGGQDRLDLSDTEAVAKAPPAAADSDEAILQLDGSGSGSGLLDLTREGDDTSLGAVLDEIYPTEDETAAGVTGLGSGITAGLGTGLASALSPALTEPQVGQGGPSETQQAAQASITRAARPFTAAMILAVVLLALAFSALAAGLLGVTPLYLRFVWDNLLYFLIGSLVAAVLVFVLGRALSK